MAKPVVALGSDHAGFALKTLLKTTLEEGGYTVLDLGTHSADSVDYPDFGKAVADAVAAGRAARGVLVCGSGIGISIAANRNPAIRCAVCRSGLEAKLARQHNDANVIALGERITGTEVALDCLHQFLNTEFDGGRHERRVAKLTSAQGA